MSTKQSSPTDSQPSEYLPCGIRNLVEDEPQLTELESTASFCGLRQNTSTDIDDQVDVDS